MNDISVRHARVSAIADALRATGFAEAASGSSSDAAALTAVTVRAAVLVRIVPQQTARHPFITLISATCRSHRACGWRAHLGADVPAPAVAALAQAALSAPMSCQATASAA